MTLPMSQDQKKESKETILKDLFKIHQMTIIMRNCLLLSSGNNFRSDYVVMAKNMALAICDLSQGIEHSLHEILEAPNWSTKDD